MGSAWDQEGDVGLRDDYDFTIETATFATDAGYNDGNTFLLMLEGKADDGEADHVWYPLGPGWYSDDQGKTIKHEKWVGGVFNPDNKSKFFNRSSLIYTILERCRNNFGIRDLLDERGTPFEAKVWEGLVFHMERETRDFGGDKLLPTAFVGIAGQSSVNVVPGDVAAKIAQAQAAATTNGNGNSPSLRQQVIDIFKTSTDFGSGQAQAFSLTGLTDDAGLVNEILDETGLYAKVKAGAVS